VIAARVKPSNSPLKTMILDGEGVSKAAYAE